VLLGHVLVDRFVHFLDPLVDAEQELRLQRVGDEELGKGRDPMVVEVVFGGVDAPEVPADGSALQDLLLAGRDQIVPDLRPAAAPARAFRRSRRRGRWCPGRNFYAREMPNRVAPFYLGSMNPAFLPQLPFALSYPLLFGLLLVAGMLGGEAARAVRLPRLLGY